MIYRESRWSLCDDFFLIKIIWGSKHITKIYIMWKNIQIHLVAHPERKIIFADMKETVFPHRSLTFCLNHHCCFLQRVENQFILPVFTFQHDGWIMASGESREICRSKVKKHSWNKSLCSPGDFVDIVRRNFRFLS